MLAFGFALWGDDSGAQDRVNMNFVVYDTAGKLHHIEVRNGKRTDHPVRDAGEETMDLAVNLASEVEDARDGRGSADLALRCVPLRDGAPIDKWPQMFMASYFGSDEDCDTTDFVSRVFLDAAPPTSLAPELTVDDRLDPPRGAITQPGEYFGPGGRRYIPRTIDGLVDVEVVRTAASAGLTVALEGDPGSGKTTLVEVAATDLVQHTFHGETTTEDVVGKFSPDQDAPSGFSWRDGPLLLAMREGRPFLADELPRAPREVQAVFFSVCDHRRAYIDAANPHVGRVDAKDGFAVFITYNPGSGFGMDDALHDRIAFTITVPTDFDTATQLGVPAPFIAAAKTLKASSIVRSVRSAARHQRVGGKAAPAEQESLADSTEDSLWYPSLRTLLKARDIAEAFGQRFAAAGMISSCPDPQRRPAVARALEKALELEAGSLRTLTSSS